MLISWWQIVGCWQLFFFIACCDCNHCYERPDSETLSQKIFQKNNLLESSVYLLETQGVVDICNLNVEPKCKKLYIYYDTGCGPALLVVLLGAAQKMIPTACITANGKAPISLK